MGTNTDASERKALVDMTIESWRFARLFGRLVGRLDAGEKGRFDSQLLWYQKRLEELLGTTGLRLVSIEGQRFDAGVAATALNAAEFGPDDSLFVDQMLEPIILDAGGAIVRAGTVLLRKFLP